MILRFIREMSSQGKRLFLKLERQANSENCYLGEQTHTNRSLPGNSNGGGASELQLSF